MAEIRKKAPQQAGGNDLEPAAADVVDAQAQTWEHVFGFVGCGALRCMLELRLPSIIHAHGGRMGLEDLAAELSIQACPSKLDRLRRVLRYLVHKKLLRMVEEEEGGGDHEEKRKDHYGLTPTSKLLVQGQEKSLEAIAMFVLQHESVAFIADLCGSSLEGMSNIGEEKEKPWSTEGDKEMNAKFMEAMVSQTSVAVEEIVKAVGKWGGLGGDDDHGVRTLVDVGGNVGQVAGAIAKAFPHVRCSVLEQGHVVDAITEPDPLVTIIKGDMFQSIPKSDVVFMKVHSSSLDLSSPDYTNLSH